ncbi:competence type IV pilus minor pilin ComGD [Gottfriedia solisilvae]|uniref:ComG operon protein 4 n=1 Tax=Gottfriedia solisilvae TaxID=1516104 RepID=A0A8J3AJ68_9BACI|nr:competence type IV pilus minor pilin ComGD [Gottfriedia solisilvae]GGI11222.1 ComG operon protein 4 [Gottfriedia solisilvae]
MKKILALYLYLKNFQKNSDGFTLVELLVVLSIIMLLMVFPIIQVKKIEEEQKIILFLQMLQNDIFLAQRNAAVHQLPTRIIFSNGSYIIEDNLLNPPILKRTFDSELIITYLSLKAPLRFNLDGNISTSGTISITYKNSKYIVTFYLGSGRFTYVKK